MWSSHANTYAHTHIHTHACKREECATDQPRRPPPEQQLSWSCAQFPSMNRMRINLEKRSLKNDVRSSHNIGEVQSTVPNPTIPGVANVHNRQVSDSLPSVAQLPEVPDSSAGGFCSPLAVYRRASSLLHSRHKMRLRQPRTTRVANSPLPMPTSASGGQKKAHSAHRLHLVPSASLAGGESVVVAAAGLACTPQCQSAIIIIIHLGCAEHLVAVALACM